MAEAPNFPLSYPGEARPAFAAEGYLKRLGRQLLLGDTSRLLTLATGTGLAPLTLAKEFGCTVVVADASEPALRTIRERLRSHGVEDRVTTKQVDYAALPFGDADFDAIYVDPRAPFSLQTAVKSLRRLLAPRGRLCLSYPVRVGRHQNPSVIRFWEQKLGEPLLLPRECLALFERSGYEPQMIESLEDPALDAFYRDVEQALSGDEDASSARVREEIALFRSQGGRSCTSFAVMIGRRKEPGEKPPTARAE